ncbi:PREDICTED: nucleolar and coiled-body phosphoprotein 1-like [Ipomoea nil]|uniref:nucleolar and coiled-body phosphoprotein 1-like n=1 Tax=Ipomoea nil TaxID=35883 RepID=UPI0009018405|nr:PREDICTED: nucleolar and coiled-body phosphoprotein 1-like [Ipomoea nil]
MYINCLVIILRGKGKGVIVMSKIAETQKKTAWSTWEELLLAFSVKRHGLKDWDSVAMELRNRSSLPALLTAQICEEKYRDLQRRFTNSDTIVEEDDGRGGGGGDVVIPWLEDLRQLRVAELKQEVHHRDLSIQSLKLKVKRMEEEREQSMKERQEKAMKPDLEDGRKENSANDATDGGGEKLDGIVGEVVSGGNSAHENRSFNESNSVEKREPDPVHVTETKPDPQAKPARENSCKDSSDRHEASKTRQESKGNDVPNDERKEGSDVESSACLKMKRRKRGEAAGGEQVAAMWSPAKRAGAVKSEPLVRLLDVIRSHKHGSVFKRRLQVQKTAKYKSIIRRHVDLETVQARIDDGSYSSCSTKFYLDLLLLFNNAIVFFPKSSPESIAAHQLRSLVMKELKIKNMNNQTPLSSSTTPPPPTKAQPDPEQDSSDSLLRCTTAAPIVVCRRRSSISAKATAAPGDDTSPKEDDSLAKLKMKERSPVTRVRSMRRTSKGRLNLNHSQPTKQPDEEEEEEEEVAKAEKKKKKEEVSSIDKKRKAADFLKRINKSSPTKETSSMDTQKKTPRDGRRQLKRNATKKKDGPATRQNAAKKSKEEESFPVKRRVGRPRRDAASDKLVKEQDKDDYSKRPKKRIRS